MNLLPLVSTILIMLAIATHTVFEKKISSQQLSKSYFGYMQAARNVQNKCIYKSFIKMKNDFISTNNKKENSKKKPKKTQYNYEPALLNIFPLLANGKDNEKDLYKIFTKLLSILYGHNDFFKKTKNFEHIIVEHLIKCHQEHFKKNPLNEFYLEKISFDDASIQLAYYKILKGTKLYDFEKELGYPSLLDFITISPKQHKIHIPYSPIETLSAIFNKKVAIAIMKKQFKDNSFCPISKHQLQQLLSDQHFAFENSCLWSNFVFSKKLNSKKPSIYMTGTDKETDIRIKTTLYLKS